MFGPLRLYLQIPGESGNVPCWDQERPTQPAGEDGPNGTTFPFKDFFFYYLKVTQKEGRDRDLADGSLCK